jgi:DNA-binding Xre family transcriptional regulator
MGIQKITTPKGERLIMMSEEEYEDLLDQIDEAAGVAAVDRFKRKLAAGEEELLPSEFVDRILDGANKVLAWREYRNVSGKQLAEAAGITQAYLSQIETGKRDGTVGTMKKIAEALKIGIDDLV